MKRRFTRKQVALFLSAVIISQIASLFAYYTSTDSVTNRFSASMQPEPDDTLRITVTEAFEPPDEKSNEPFQKRVQISNTGMTDCHIRVRLEFSSSEVRDISWLSNDDDKDNSEAYVNAADFPDSELPGSWIYRGYDGFYYYTEPVAPGETTVPLIKWVKTVFPDGSSDISGYDIFVYSEAAPADDEDGNRLGYENVWD
ncbi:MAG: hypothetical protein IJ874_07860 [Ruminococcus sp.]|nr:hypothetical protein [Ruminococcus sp.]